MLRKFNTKPGNYTGSVAQSKTGLLLGGRFMCDLM